MLSRYSIRRAETWRADSLISGKYREAKETGGGGLVVKVL